MNKSIDSLKKKHFTPDMTHGTAFTPDMEYHRRPLPLRTYRILINTFLIVLAILYVAHLISTL